jgi:translocation and assembly module TamA
MHRRRTTLIGLLLLICGSAAAQAPELAVEITGVSGELLDNVRAGLGLYQQREHPLLSDALIQRLHERADGEIRRALEPFGYYRARVDGALTQTEAGWRAHYAIDPGEPIRLTDVSIALEGDGATDAALQAWRAAYPLRPGGVLLHKAYDDAKRKLVQLARERGFVEGRLLKNVISVDLDRYQATVELQYDTGPRYAFGEVTFVQEGFDDTFLRRFLTFEYGDPYNAAKLVELQRVLSGTDYFEQADITSLTDQAVERHVPVRIELSTRKTARYSAGIGYATDTGVRGMLGYEKRRANEFGHRYGLRLEQSEIDTNATAHYQIPMEQPATDSLSFTLTWEEEDTDTVHSIKTSLGPAYSRQTGPWLREVGLSYEMERYRLGNEDDSNLLIPRVRLQYVSAENRIQTRSGWLASAEVRGAYDQLFSDTSFLQVRSDDKFIQGLGEHARVLLRGSAGASVTPELTDLPASQRFLAGGDQSIRGYDYESLGPVNDEGEVIGGKYLLVGSIELEQDIRANVALAVFFDAGNAFDEEDFDVMRGSGFGLRWRTPVGPVRIDLAQALDEDGTPWRLHLTVGPDL